VPLYSYFELAANFELPAVEALAFFQAKGLKPTFAWQDMLGDEHDLAFTVAKMMDNDLLATVKGKLDKALNRGDTLADFKRELIPTLQAAGWWGKSDVIDPLTGQVKQAQLGSASRLETIFRTNLQSAYAVGRWQAIEDQADQAPYLMYDAVDDHRTRPEHQALDGLVLKVDDPYWNSHAPSNGWNCRCGLIQLDDDQLKDHGLREGKAPRIRTRKWTNPRTDDVHKVPTDLDPGWDHNPGKVHQEQQAATKLAQADAAMAAQVANYKGKVAKLKADQSALKGKLQAQVQQLASAELGHHLDE
jgi:SPP1 gp7 family putative phage head morphogenesis protein